MLASQSGLEPHMIGRSAFGISGPAACRDANEAERFKFRDGRRDRRAIQAVLDKVIEGERGNALVGLHVPLLVISGSPRPCFVSRDRRRPHDAYDSAEALHRFCIHCESVIAVEAGGNLYAPELDGSASHAVFKLNDERIG
jgi:hypothetical protein